MMAVVISEKQDLTWLNWSKIRNTSGTAGSFLKSYSEFEGKKVYYKLSNYDAFKGVTGHECVNEIIADRLLTILGIEHLEYQLIHADIMIDGLVIDTWLCASNDFKQYGESKISLDIYYQQEHQPGESPLAFCIRSGWKDYIYKMLVVDYLILNRDRHGANMELLRSRTKKSIRPAPLFDHGLSFVCTCHTEKELNEFDVMSDKRVQCFVGGNSAWRNLKLIPPDQYPKINPIDAYSKEYIMDGLESALPKLWQDKIWLMISKRWEQYESLRDSR